MKKKKLNIAEQIEYMRDSKGILFTIISEEEAYEFLTINTYYYKLKAFAKNYPKYINKSCDNYGKYINLEFAYLKELSTLDAVFRKKVLEMALDIEHFLKVQLIRDVSEDAGEDGYKIVEDFFDKIKPNLKNEIISKSKNSYTFPLVDKYKDEFPIWSLVEVLSFGEFIDLYEYYYSFHENKYDMKGKLYPIKWLRNAAAHNNCLINNLIPPFAKEIQPHRSIMSKISKIKNMPKRTRESKMKNPTIHDFVVLLDVFCTIVQSKKTISYGMEGISEFFHKRCLKHKEYFIANENIKTNYEFLVKVVDFYSKKAYNN